MRIHRVPYLALVLLPLFARPALAQESGTVPPFERALSLRGLSVLSAQAAWVSGPGGNFAWTTNGGRQWLRGSVRGAEGLDFRDLHAVSLDTVYLMAAGQDTARIYKTTDRGANWTLQYDDTRPGMFLDAVAFFDATHGLALGDPVDGRFVLLRTENGGAHWTRIDSAGMPPALPNEAAFAASGTALVVSGTHAWFATGAARVSRVFHSVDGGRHWTVAETPIAAGKPSAGIFSLAFADERTGIAVGGNYQTPDSTVVTVARTIDGGATWIPVRPAAAIAYLSGVAYVADSTHMRLVAVGTPGVAVSADGGRTWMQLQATSFNSVAAIPGPTTGVWMIGDRSAVDVLRSAAR